MNFNLHSNDTACRLCGCDWQDSAPFRSIMRNGRVYHVCLDCYEHYDDEMTKQKENKKYTVKHLIRFLFDKIYAMFGDDEDDT